jgi:hypothetical protein
LTVNISRLVVRIGRPAVGVVVVAWLLQPRQGDEGSGQLLQGGVRTFLGRHPDRWLLCCVCHCDFSPNYVGLAAFQGTGHHKASRAAMLDMQPASAL